MNTYRDCVVEMIYHIFNSSLISGPETLVFPALVQLKDKLKDQVQIILLRESRIPDEKQKHVVEYIEKLGLRYQIIPVHSRYDVQAIQKLTNILEQTIDLKVAHAHDVKPSMYLLRAAQKIRNRAFTIISTHHGVRARSGLINRLYEIYYARFILPAFDRVLTVCTSDKVTLVKRGLHPNQVEIHLNGVTRIKVSSSERAVKQQQIRQSWNLGTAPGAFIFGVAARLETEKRHGLLLNVVQEIIRLAPHFEFVVVCFGRGALGDSLKQQTTKLGLSSCVLWKGYRAGLGDEFAGFDALLSVSRAEGLPINLIEAGWAATPIFASAVDGVKDLVSTEDLGALVPADEKPEIIANQIIQFANSLQSLEKKGRAFQQHVEKNFSQESWLQKLLEIYAETKVVNKSEARP